MPTPLQAESSAHKPVQQTVRIAAVPYLSRSINDWDAFENQVSFMMKAAGDSKPQFVVFPESFTTRLLSFLDTGDLRKVVRGLGASTDRYTKRFVELAKQWGVYIIGGHPTITDGKLLNTAYLFSPECQIFTQDKIHLTRWEREEWQGDPGQSVRVFETAQVRISFLVCYAIEFPERAWMVCEQGSGIIFVLLCTDDKQGFWRVRYCCHARAIKNQVQVALTGTLENRTVEGLGLHFGQGAIITPSDFPFARDGVAAEGFPNMEQIVIADVDLSKRVSNRINVTTIPLHDKRVATYETDVGVIQA